MKKLFVFALLFWSAFSFAQKPTDKRLAGLDTFVTKVLKDWHAAGVGIAVVEKNKIVYTGGFGYRDVENKIPVTENTQFAIGSCTKAFTASLLGLAVKDGKLDIDKPVTDYLPELKFSKENLTAHVTVRDMMCHRTGLPRHDLAWYGSSTSRDTLLYAIRFFEPSAELRQIWQYNNFMFLAQGVLAQKLYGKSWESLIKEKIFDPLEMKNSNLSITDLEKYPDHSVGYNVKNDSIKRMKYMNIDAMGPAGSINSTPKEMANWVITWVNGGKFNNKEVIPAMHVQQAMSSQMVIAGSLPDKQNPDVNFANYGFGWMLTSYRSHYRVEHGGNIDGFSASTCLFPGDSIGIVILSNQNGSSVPAIIRNFIADRMLGLSYRNWNQQRLDDAAKAKKAAKERMNSDSANQKLGTKPSHALNEYEGTFKNDGYGKVVVSTKDNHLQIDYGQLNFRLKHYHYDIFNAYPTNEGLDADEEDATKIDFNTNLKGEIESIAVTLEPAVNPIVFKKEIKEIKIDKAELAKYTGIFELGPQTIKFDVRGEGVLWASIAGQPDYELVPVKKDEFNFKILNGFSVRFEADDKGAYNTAYFIQPNGTFKAIKKK
ncbi:MAG: serine hydrolase [Sphingobacteriales bacterium]|nr:MAG: serine hydrolase [Sphingobacteriales bacterium]